jgi:serine/threonine protein kinase
MDATQTNLGISREDFLHRLASSRLFEEAELQRLALDYPGEDAIGIAHALVVSGALTSFQLDAITEGRTTDLKMGNYDILDRLGAGGMGTVLKARHRRMKRIVALKVLLADLCKDESFIQRFQREVVTIASLQHPNIVMAFDADEAEIGHFLVMEFVDGRDLASTVEKGGPLDLARAVNYTIQAARGLGYAHSRQVIHRDIKPANLMLDSSGTVKVTDLGLARINPAAGGAPSTTGLTQAGGILGTVDYMAPEQAVDSTAIDHRADIYSLGCTLFFLLTGRTIFAGGNAMSVLVKHRESPAPSLPQAREDAPAELDAIFQKMVAKAVEDRYATMDDVVAALEGIAGRVGGTVAPRAVDPVKSPSSIAMRRADQGTIVTSIKPLSVLIVEPSRMQAGIIRKYLEEGAIAFGGAAKTGAEALVSLRMNKPDAIVAALHLDDMTGIELAKKVRGESSTSRTGFVLISSETDRGESDSLSKLDRTVLLAKPFTAEQLREAIGVVTGRSPATGSTDFSIAPGLNRSTLKILIVDDSIVARTHERGVLKALGFSNFVEAADGAQAIAVAACEQFDLIVTDYNMPLMDGHALVMYLRQTPATANIPIIMVTTETEPKVLEPVRRLGVAGICEKTFTVDEVRSIVDRLF